MFVGAEAPAITNRAENGDNDFIYRTSFGVDTASAKFIDYIVGQGVKSVDMIYKNDEFGKGGRDAYAAAFKEVGITIQLDIQVQPDQIDLSAEVSQLAGGTADAIFAFIRDATPLSSTSPGPALEKQIYARRAQRRLDDPLVPRRRRRDKPHAVSPPAPIPSVGRPTGVPPSADHRPQASRAHRGLS